METGSNLSGHFGKQAQGQSAQAGGHDEKTSGLAGAAAQLPHRVRASVASGRGEYDALRLRSQREVIRDVMLAAADCDTWLTLGELRALTRYGEASISAQLRHLRKLENGGYEVTKRHREDAAAARPSVDGRGECVWEYCIARAVQGSGSRSRFEI